MNTPPTSPNPIGSPRRIELEYEGLDCPSMYCNGWLRLFANEGCKDACFVSCSNDFEAQGHTRCTQKVMFSKFATVCPKCKLSIRKQEIITCIVSGGKWVHIRCFRSEDEEYQLIAICQRCRRSIYNEADATPSMCAGKTGFRHLKCPNRRKLPDDVEETLPQEDEEPEGEAKKAAGSSSSSSSSNKKIKK